MLEEEKKDGEKDNALVLANRSLIPLVNWLGTLKLPGKLSRNRTRFINILTPFAEENGKFYNEIIDKYTLKDKGGNRKIVKSEIGVESWDIPKDKLDKFNNDVNELMDENTVITVNASNKGILGSMKGLILETETEFSSDVAIQYDKWCNAFEKIKT